VIKSYEEKSYDADHTGKTVYVNTVASRRAMETPQPMYMARVTSNTMMGGGGLETMAKLVRCMHEHDTVESVGAEVTVVVQPAVSQRNAFVSQYEQLNESDVDAATNEN
jgi:hypothetical protein